MLISIIIPAFNAENYIKDALDSIISQSFNDYEIIVVNDGSSDKTTEIVKKYPVKIIDQINSGASVARNNGLKAARGEYVFFMDADDSLKENVLEKMAELMVERVDLVIGLYSMYNLDKNIKIFEKDSNISGDLINNRANEDVINTLGIYRLSSCPWRYFVKRELLIDNKLFFNEKSLVEDAIWVPKLLCTAKSFMLNDEAFYNYKIHSNSVSTSKMFKFYRDALEGCRDLFSFSLTVENYKRPLVYKYLMMLLVGVMQDYNFLKNEEKRFINSWFKDNKKIVDTSIKVISPLKLLGIFIGNRNALHILGMYLKRKNRV